MNRIDQARGVINLPSSDSGVVILTGTAKKQVTEQKNKGYSYQIKDQIFFILKKFRE